MSRPTFISCDRLDLKPPEEGDVEFLRDGVNNPRIRQYISAFRTPYTEERYRDEWWELEHDGDSVSLLVVPTEGEFETEPVGSVSLAPIAERDGYANFGVWLHPKAWGRGTLSKPALT